MRTSEKNLLLGALIVVVLLSVTGAINLNQLWQPGTVTPGQTGDDWIAVNRLLDFAATDKYAGSASASKTIYVYDGTTLLETLTTTSDGTIATSNPYPSGKHLNLKYVDSNAKFWVIDFVVPKMLKTDAVSTTALNTIKLETWQAETFTDLLSKGATTYADAATFNYTSVGDTGTLVYGWTAATDNRAIISSPKDPIYNCEYQTTMFIVLSAGDYDKCILNGMDGMYATASARVYWKVLPDSQFICWKVGTNYVSTGSGSVSVPYDVTGMSNTATTNTTMQVYIFSCSSHTYAQTYSATGSTASAYGPDAVELTETTLTLYT